MRQKGSGSIYQRADGMWLASIEVGTTEHRKRRVVTSKSKHVVEAKVEAILASMPPLKNIKTRAEYMIEARAKATHTKAEWDAKSSGVTHCRYCRTSLNMFNENQDHILAVANGGSDGIENVQLICWECNRDKGDRLDYEYPGNEPRPFRVFPNRRGMHKRVMKQKELWSKCH